MYFRSGQPMHFCSGVDIRHQLETSATLAAIRRASSRVTA
jgi:hypothetical protein